MFAVIAKVGVAYAVSRPGLSIDIYKATEYSVTLLKLFRTMRYFPLLCFAILGLYSGSAVQADA